MKKLIPLIAFTALGAMFYCLGFEKQVLNVFYSPYTYIIILALYVIGFLLENEYLNDELTNQQEGIEHLITELDNAKQKYFDLINNKANADSYLTNALTNKVLLKKLERTKDFVCHLRTYLLKEASTTDEIHIEEMIKELENDLNKI